MIITLRLYAEGEPAYVSTRQGLSQSRKRNETPTVHAGAGIGQA